MAAIAWPLVKTSASIFRPMRRRCRVHGLIIHTQNFAFSIKRAQDIQACERSFEWFMPTVLRHGPYRFYFYSNDGGEPAHVHVERDQHVAKFWLDPVRVQRSGGFGRPEILRLSRLVHEIRHQIIEAWDEYFRA